MANPVRRVAILGSTGSIGTQTLDVVRAFPGRLSVAALAAGKNLALLERQVAEFDPDHVLCTDAQLTPNLRSRPCASLEEMAVLPDVDIVVIATVGSAGLRPTLRALEAGKIVALANKEVLIMAGRHVMDVSRRTGNPVLPVDSEPSAIWQCLLGEDQPVQRLMITASGGAFRDRSWKSLADVQPEEALRHPTWKMGPKITIDSATLVNKAFEVIEAHWLFDVPFDRIDVVIHRQSVIHSMVELDDGAVKAHLGPPDMRYPIQYALFYPERTLNPALPRFDPVQVASLTFESMNPALYPCFGIALEAGRRGGTWPAALMGADEAAVHMFIAGRIKFTEIPEIIQTALSDHHPIMDPTIDDVQQASEWAAEHAVVCAGMS